MKQLSTRSNHILKEQSKHPVACWVQTTVKIYSGQAAFETAFAFVCAQRLKLLAVRLNPVFLLSSVLYLYAGVIEWGFP